MIDFKSYSFSSTFKRPMETSVYVLFPLMVGGLIYVSWRSTHLVLFDWLHQLGLTPAVSIFRSMSIPVRSYLPDFILYSLPDGLWAFTLTAGILSIWQGQLQRNSLFWVSFAFILILGYEFAQISYIGLFSGTFDIMDLLFYCGGFTSAIYLSWRYNANENIQT